ncbi:MAG: calcium/sodium antiporter [Aggregatilineales bacterium]
MLLYLGMIGLGIGGLWFGGDFLVKAASRLATSFGVPALLVGLTVVAWATSAPELVVSISAAIQGSSDIAIGNVVGSNIVNIGLIIGLSALIFPIRVNWDLIVREMPIMIAISVAAFVMALDGVISVIDGFLLFGGFLAYNAMQYLIVRYKRDHKSPELAEIEEMSQQAGTVRRSVEVLRLLAGLAALVIGAQLTVTGATGAARQIGVSELVIGLTLVAVGTSLPELAASFVAALRKQSDIAVGNVVGSNIANILAILGLTAIIRPISVEQTLITLQFPIMLAFAIGMLLLGFNRVIGRVKGGLILAAYIGVVAVTFVNM